MTDKQKLGIKGEKAVAKFLKKNKYRIISKNYSCKYGEIDLVAENRSIIAFVEVKTRTEGQMLAPRFSVDYRKQQRILKTAKDFLDKYSCNKQPRFDIAEVTVNSKGKLVINYIDNAYIQGGDYAVY